MTQPDPATAPPYAGATDEALRALVASCEADGLPYPMDLAVPAEPVPGATASSVHVVARDGVRLAVTVHLPPAGERLPTCLRSTRYWRATEESPVKEHLEALEAQRWVAEGFALVLVDARGTGASYGTWQRAWSDTERDDLVDVLDWVVAQPWSDGTVGGYGTSYDGTTAHLLAATGHPAVRAVVPRFGLFDSWGDVAAPGGVPLDHFLEHWAAINWALDGHPERGTVELPIALAGSVRRVDGDDDGALLAAAQADHVGNWDLWADVREATAREQVSAEPDLGNGTPLHRIDALRTARVPMWLWSSWYDGAYAAAQLRQLADPGLDVRVTLGPFSHGASMTPLGDPLRADARNIPVAQQVRRMAAFLRRHLTGAGVDPSPAALHYYRLGDGWQESDVWPPRDVTVHRLALGGTTLLGAAGGSRTWKADPTASSGSAATRWHGLIGGAPVDYGDRRAQDDTRLVWEGPVLTEPLGLTGTPVVSLDLVSSVEDVALHAYLEAELADGRVLYLTEGLLRASHRDLPSATLTTTPREPGGEVRPLVVGAPQALRWELLPISVLLPAGSRLRVALAGGDAPLFRRVPADGDVELEVLGSSWIDLPLQSPLVTEGAAR